MHTQKTWCACVHGYKGYDLPLVKKNQPRCMRTWWISLTIPRTRKRSGRTPKAYTKGTGASRIHELWASKQMNAWFETEWAGVAQVFRLRRDVKEGDKEREERVYGLTNLPRHKANASRLLALQQAHWRIENRLHWRRDVTDSGKMHARSEFPVLLKLWRHSMGGSSL